MICKLISTNHLIPNQKILKGESLIIGRNRNCRIKEIKCPRNFAKVQLKNKLLNVEYLKTGKTDLIRSGNFLNGPGFSFKIEIIDDELINNNGKFNFIQF